MSLLRGGLAGVSVCEEFRSPCVGGSTVLYALHDFKWERDFVVRTRPCVSGFGQRGSSSARCNSCVVSCDIHDSPLEEPRSLYANAIPNGCRHNSFGSKFRGCCHSRSRPVGCFGTAVTGDGLLCCPGAVAVHVSSASP